MNTGNTEQPLHEGQAAAGMEGGSRPVRQQLPSDCRLGESVQESRVKNAQGENH